jgi:acyl carrier protein
MGLDTVELILRVEETFDVSLPDEDCGSIRTVGDLYRLVLLRLDLPYEASSAVESSQSGSDRSTRQFSAISSWNTPDVWLTRKGIIQDQLQVRPAEIHEDATFSDDLRCD